MTDDGVEALVTRLYAAAGAREAGPVDFEVYADALAGTDDEVALAAGRELVREVDLASHRPSPALVRQQVQSILRRRQLACPAIPSDTGPVMDAETVKANLAALRKRRCGEAKPIAASLPRVRVPAPTAHELDDHQFCQPDNPCRQPTPDQPPPPEPEPQ